jgi:hypothetical protein
MDGIEKAVVHSCHKTIQDTRAVVFDLSRDRQDVGKGIPGTHEDLA